MMETKNNIKFKQGFTLIELLIVIAIIGILSSITLVSTQSAVEKAKKASAIASASSVITELVTCQDDGGHAKNSAPAAGDKICCTTTACGTFVDGHSTIWPDISKTGWAYVYVSGDALTSDYKYNLTKTGQTTIVCDMAANGCN